MLLPCLSFLAYMERDAGHSPIKTAHILMHLLHFSNQEQRAWLLLIICSTRALNVTIVYILIEQLAIKWCCVPRVVQVAG